MEKLKPQDLSNACHCNKFKFQSSDEIPVLINTVGQDRGIQAIWTGLNTSADGFNIFITGPSGSGRNSTIQAILGTLSKKQETPDDWCYVYNFVNSNFPKAINLKPGEGHIFKKDMEEFIALSKERVSKAFESEHHDREKGKIISEISKRSSALTDSINKIAEELGFQVNSSPEGIFTVPVINDKPLTPEEYQALDDKTKEAIDEKRDQLQIEINNAIKKGQQMERQLRQKLAELDKRIGLFALDVLIDDLKVKYQNNSKVLLYLDAVKEDIVNNINYFKEDSKQKTAPPIPGVSEGKSKEEFFDRYQVNLLIDHSQTKGAPVVREINPSYYNIFGSIEYIQHYGVMQTDLSLIRSGSILKANGGYLILQAADLLSAPYLWDNLKRTLKSKQCIIENLDEQIKIIPTVSLKPDPIPLDLKVIIVGTEYEYSLFYQYDGDFRKLFKIVSQFDYEMTRNQETEELYASFVGTHCKQHNPSISFSGEAIAKIIEHGSRLVEDKNKLSTRFSIILDLVLESIHWAEKDKKKKVQIKHVVQTIQEKRYRSNLYEEKVFENIHKKVIRIDTADKQVAQINGLSVLGSGDYAFGQANRITASTSIGKGNVVNIEKESQLSGPIFDKGVFILSAYLSREYASDRPFPVTISLCFEQSYGGVDGDSASAAELVAILSSLSELPLRQDLAITGSIDQFGNIQPIGGVNYKIEGFFDICCQEGLSGSQGVVIPWQNVQHLMLREDVIQAVADGKFHIYSIKHVKEALELFMDLDSKKMDKAIIKKLEHFIKIAREYRKET
jgi:lon-related putative ATP-dependent protease